MSINTAETLQDTDTDNATTGHRDGRKDETAVVTDERVNQLELLLSQSV